MILKTTKSKNEEEYKYLDWLYSLIKTVKSSDLDFLSDLYDLNFYCKIPNDDNRIEDGLRLREQYPDSDNLQGCLIKECSVLEMLIALAFRMDYILFDPNKGDRPQEWFWLFIKNLGLKSYKENEDFTISRSFNKTVIKKFVNREYGYDGIGGIFPLKSPQSDQRYVEVWYQMMAYISENFDIF